MGHQTQRLTSSLLIISIILFLLAAQPYPAQAERAQLDGKQFGPVLFLLSPTAEQASLLPSLPVTIHATLFGQPVDRYIASGDAAAETQIIAAGVDVRVLDAATSGKVYYFIDTSAENARQLAATYGTMIYGDPLQSLLAAPQASEAALVAELPAAGVPIALLSTDAIVLGRPWVASLAATVPPVADPAIQALLVQVSETRIHDLIADLSGARATLIDGKSVTIPTRYSFAAGITNAEAYVRQHYAALGLTTRTLPWAYSSYSGRNITADITGIVHPERIWLVGGHLDSTSTAPYSTAPGADDNASGTAATLALAEILHDLHFADTIRFVHFTGEEQGMWGSKVYARDLQISGAQVMGYINLDMIGWDSDDDRTVELHSGTGSPSVALANAFVSANERYGQSLRLELKQGTASRFSDHSSFWDYGYASFLTLENFYDDAIVRDRNPWYHTTGDLLSRVDLNYVARSARTALATMAELAGIITGPLPTTTPTLTPSPTPTATSTRTPTATPAPGVCQQLIANGGFEAATAWVMPSTAYPAAYSATRAYSGLRSLRAGVDTIARSLLLLRRLPTRHHPCQRDHRHPARLVVPALRRGQPRHRPGRDPAAHCHHPGARRRQPAPGCPRRRPPVPAHPRQQRHYPRHPALDPQRRPGLVAPHLRPHALPRPHHPGPLRRLQRRQRPVHQPLSRRRHPRRLPAQPGFAHAITYFDAHGIGHTERDT